jgi:hypothetical protein
VASRSPFAVVPIGGFNPDRIRSLKDGMETTLGTPIAAAAILDRDFRSADECDVLARQCEAFCDYIRIHSCKEIENFLLVGPALDRAIQRRVADRANRTGNPADCSFSSSEFLHEFSKQARSAVTSQYLAKRRLFDRSRGTGNDEATANQQVLDELEKIWTDPSRAIQIVPGKDALAALNQEVQASCGVSITPTSIISAMRRDEIPSEMNTLIECLAGFSSVELHTG